MKVHEKEKESNESLKKQKEHAKNSTLWETKLQDMASFVEDLSKSIDELKENVELLDMEIM